MIRGILLAAGSASRFGAHKLLHPLPWGEPIAVAAARTLLEVLPESIAVIRPHDTELAERLATTGIRIVTNQDADSGMGGSLALGVAATPQDCSGWAVALADMPFIRRNTIQAVVDRLDDHRAIALPLHRGRRGHPVAFACRYRSRLIRLSGDQGGRQLLTRYGQWIRTAAVDDPGILADIDSPSDLERYAPLMTRQETATPCMNE